MKAYTSRAGSEEKVKQDDHPIDRKHFHDDQHAVLAIGSEEQARSNETGSTKWMRNETTAVDYHDKRPERQLKFAPPYLQACRIPKSHHASWSFTAPDVRYVGNVVAGM